MIPIISIIGRRNSGKTTLIEKLIPELIKRGYGVATVKHHVHKFDIDKEGKDSWRHKKAGAKISIVSSPKKIAIFEDTDGDNTLEELRSNYIKGVDIILSEGYKKGYQPKIEVARVETGNDLLCNSEDNLIAIVSSQSYAIGLPVFSPDDIKELTNLIEEKFLNRPDYDVEPGGKIIAVNISVKKGMKKKDVGSAYVKENYGIENDAHSGHWHRQISLLAMESIDKMKQKGLNVTPGSFAENITTEGINLLNLRIGDTLLLGGKVVLEITQLGKVCHDRCAIYYQAGDCVMPKEGVFAMVKRSGCVKIGDEISACA